MKAYRVLMTAVLVLLPVMVLTSEPEGMDTLKTSEGLQPPIFSAAQDFGKRIYDENQAFVKPDEQTLLNQLSYEAFAVTQRCGTEPPFNNAYWDHYEKGIYVDVVSGEPLFASVHKYDSGTGWPSFWRSIDQETLRLDSAEGSIDYGFEVKSAQAESHLGHVFNDGPKPSGLRFCINSAALRFVPFNEMADRGYGKYLYLFDE